MKIVLLMSEFDAYLHQRKLQFHAVVIGGAALNLLGVVSRYTRDCDVLDPKIPPEVLQASKDFASKARARGEILADDWLNNGPETLKRTLPAGWQQRLQALYEGKAMQLETLGREDLLKSKFFAYCDRGTDWDDCLKLKPMRDEIREALVWVQDQDANPDWPAHVLSELRRLAKELGYEL